MVVARFKQPVNMGENAHEVRLFVLVVVPTVEKTTKDQLETGRTFATMLTDAEFRQQLFQARNEIEFKALMLVKARQLARAERLKNRHKYQLDFKLRESISSSSYYDNSPNSCDKVQLTKGPIGQPEGFFGKNPHTGKLFELIAEAAKPAPAEADDKSANNLKRRNLDAGKPAKGEKMGRDESPSPPPSVQSSSGGCCFGLEFGKGVWRDFINRARYYPSDFVDAFVGPPRTVQKTVATIWFLYFGILLPTIAFSSLNTNQTHGHMGDLRKAIIGQAIGGLIFALLGGQPIVIIMTTAPLCLYTKGKSAACPSGSITLKQN